MLSAMEAAQKLGGPLLPSGIPEHYREHVEPKASQLWKLGLWLARTEQPATSTSSGNK